jgi:hypothetical protein
MFLRILVFFSLVTLGNLVLANPLIPSFGYVKNFSCNDGVFGLGLPSDVRGLTHLGKVLQRRTGEVTNWDDYYTNLNYLHYSGLDIDYITFSNDPTRYMISRVEVTSSKWKITGPFRIGNAVSAVQKMLGRVAKDDAELKRQYGSESDRVNFEQVKGKVTKISYECYTG